jgi:uncharacterized membrane protein HdeD (DUF308 family)
VTESLAATAFYVGLAAFIYGIVRVTRASVERRRPDRFGIVFIAVGALLFIVAIAIYLRSGKEVLPF